MSDSLGFYSILGVLPNSDAKTIKLNYRDKAKEWHPDYNKSENAMEHFQKLSVAYEVLQNDKSRLEYDLFSEVYTAKDFPPMDSLAVIKDRQGQENPFVRVIDLRYVVGKVIKHTFREEKLVCDAKQAGQEVLKCSFLNWSLGWWGLKAFAKNLKAISQNIKQINRNKHANLTLLIHNMVVYNKEGKIDKSYVSARQALEYANNHQREMTEKFIANLDYKKNIRLPVWNYTKLKLLQLIIPFILVLMVSYPFIRAARFARYMNKENEITYFQKVSYNNGAETVDDLVVSKVFDIPVDVYDDSKLYHLVSDTNVMYGPSKRFDIMAKLEKGRTVRITGFTVDKAWYRIMLDSGEMGFVEEDELIKGVGNDIKFNSKISAKAKSN